MRVLSLVAACTLLIAGIALAEGSTPCERPTVEQEIANDILAQYLGITQAAVRHTFPDKKYKHLALVLKRIGGEDGTLQDETMVSCDAEDVFDHVRCIFQIPQSASLLAKANSEPLPIRLSIESYSGTNGNSSTTAQATLMGLPEDFHQDRSGATMSGSLNPKDSRIDTLPSGANVVPLHYFVYPKQGRVGKSGGTIEALRRDNPGANILLAYLVMDDKPIEDTSGDFEAQSGTK